MKLDREIFSSFKKAAKEVGMYLKCGVGAPADVESKYKEALLILRGHLEHEGIPAPEAMYPYDRKNQNTHRYIERCEDADGRVRLRSAFPQINPNYMWRDKWRLNRLKMKLK